MTETASYFDCNLCIGNPARGAYASCASLAEAAHELDWCGVDQALVWHTLMREYSPAVGNRILQDELRQWQASGGDPSRFVGTAAILPPHTRELGRASLLHAVISGDVSAFWAWPDQHRYLLNRPTFGSFLDEVSERKVPLFLPREAGGSSPADTWQMLTALLAEYPRLRVVVAHHGPWGEDRFFRPLLERYEGLHLDLSRYELDGGIRELCDTFGSRLLYGSHFPYTSMGGARMMVACADVDDQTLVDMAGGNLRRLLAEVAR